MVPTRTRGRLLCKGAATASILLALVAVIAPSSRGSAKPVATTASRPGFPRGETASAGKPPVLIGIERNRQPTLAIAKRPGPTVARFGFADCPGPPFLAARSPYGLEVGTVAPDPHLFAIRCGAEGQEWIEMLSAGGGRGIVRAGSAARDLSLPVWSPRSRAIGFTSGDFSCGLRPQESPSTIEVWTARLGEQARKLARVVATESVVDASVEGWSPTGTALLVKVSEFDGECRYQAHLRDTLYAVFARKRGPSVRRLAVLDEIGHAEWSPNGRLIAVTQGEGDSCNLDVLHSNGRTVRTVAAFDYVPGGCFADGLATAWLPSSEQIAFSNGATVFSANAHSGAPREVYRARPRLRSCSPETANCPALWIRDVTSSGDMLVSPDLRSGRRVVHVVESTGKATRVVEKRGTTAIRFAVER